MTQRAALGFRAHSGWAVLVAVGGPPGSPEVIERRRIELTDGRIPEAMQPYHAAERLDLKQAERLVRRCADAAARLARQAVEEVVADLRQKGHDPAGCCILRSSGRPLGTLQATLASHAMIHTAEGELFRDALQDAGEHCGLPVTGVKEREVFARGAAELGLPVEELQRRIAELGRSLGPPWRQDEKLATLAGWIALAAASQR